MKPRSRKPHPPPAGLARALDYHRRGDFGKAELLYRDLLAARPENQEVLYLLGSLLAQRGDYAEAEILLTRALDRDRAHPEALNNLGIVYRERGRTEQAIACLERAIALRPDYAQAHNNLGDALRAAGRMEEAAARFRKALRLDPRYAEACNNLGVVLAEQGRHEESERWFVRALELNPDYARAHHNLGQLYEQRHEPERAVRAYEQARRLNPRNPETCFRLGVLHQAAGRHAEAAELYRAALAHKPDRAETHLNLGALLLHDGRIAEASALFRRALELAPDMPQAWNNLGHAHQLAGELDEATRCYREALAREPGYAAAHSNLLLCLNYADDRSPEDVLAEHRAWGNAHAPASRRAPSAPPAEPAPPGRRIRIGYVSPDFRTHSVAYFIRPVLASHDRERFEIFAYASVPAPDAATRDLQALTEHWRFVDALTDQELAQRIRDDGIDVLVDLAGHTAGHRLGAFALQPAPVQITYLGYPNTTGMAAMDFRLTDARADPPGSESRYTERLLRLPDGFLCYAPPAEAPPVGPLPALAAGHVTFGSFNNLSKITPGAIALWCAILRRVPGARLLLKSKPLRDEAVRARIRAAFADRGIDPGRVELLGWLPACAQHLALYDRIDVALDTFPYNGTATTCEALWMGVPVVALSGTTHAGRVGASVLNQAGLADLIARDPANYAEIAVALAADLARLSDRRAALRPHLARSPLCQAEPFTRALEAAYVEAWHSRMA